MHPTLGSGTSTALSVITPALACSHLNASWKYGFLLDDEMGISLLQEDIDCSFFPKS